MQRIIVGALVRDAVKAKEEIGTARPRRTLQPVQLPTTIDLQGTVKNGAIRMCRDLCAFLLLSRAESS